MSCPFRRTSSHAISNGALKRSFTSRQSSVQIPNDDQDDEDKNTLNLKHLNASLLMLTAPPPALIEKYTGRYESYELTTPDGYILTIHRLPPRKNPKGVVLLKHPMMMDSRVWMGQGNRSTALTFWRDGYDVWLGNQRGTYHSERHVKMSISNSNYWDFSFHEIGQFDIPTEIHFILSKTGNKEKIIFVGHSLGTTTALVYSSMLPIHAQNSVEVFILAAPAVYFTHCTATPAALFSSILPTTESTVKALDLGALFPLLPTIHQLFRIFHRRYPEIMPWINWAYGFFFGFSNDVDPRILNLDWILNIKNLSWKLWIHYLQLVVTKDRFQMFDYGPEENTEVYGGPEPWLYPIEDISVPVVLISSSEDTLTSLKDADLLYDRLPKAAKKYGKLHLSRLNHNDFHWGKHKDQYFVGPVLNLMNNVVKRRAKIKSQTRNRLMTIERGNVTDYLSKSIYSFKNIYLRALRIGNLKIIPYYAPPYTKLKFRFIKITQP